MTDEFQVGAITQTHGVKGEVKVFPTTDDASRFKKLKEVIADTGEKRISLHITGVKFFKQFVIIKFKECNSMDEAQTLKGAKLIVDRANAVKLEADEFFIADLIGLKVISDEEEELGILTDVIQTGANDVYVVDMDERELLIPAIKDCILKIDTHDGYIRVHLMEGLG